MRLAIARFAAVLLIGLLAGSALANFLLEASLGRSAAFNIEYKQVIIRAYTVALPVLGAGGIASALAVAYLARRDRITLWFTTGAVLCCIAGLAITLTVHFPINDQVIAWSPTSPPAEWRLVLDRWRASNNIRTVMAIAAFVLLLIPTLARQSR